jgi:hypothetical protein
MRPSQNFSIFISLSNVCSDGMMYALLDPWNIKIASSNPRGAMSVYVCVEQKVPGGGVEFNPLNAELNHICHSLISLGDLTFMGTCIVSIFQYVSNKMQRYTYATHSTLKPVPTLPR